MLEVLKLFTGTIAAREATGDMVTSFKQQDDINRMPYVIYTCYTTDSSVNRYIVVHMVHLLNAVHST